MPLILSRKTIAESAIFQGANEITVSMTSSSSTTTASSTRGGLAISIWGWRIIGRAWL